MDNKVTLTPLRIMQLIKHAIEHDNARNALPLIEGVIEELKEGDQFVRKEPEPEAEPRHKLRITPNTEIN